MIRRIERRGLGYSITDLAKVAAASGGGSTNAKGEKIPAPMELYDQAAPAVVNALRQYNNAAPTIDWVSKNLWATLGIVVLVGVGSSYLGSLLYHLIHERKPRR